MSKLTSNAAVFAADLSASLAQVEAELLDNPYISERHPILLQAVAHSRALVVAGIAEAGSAQAALQEPHSGSAVVFPHIEKALVVSLETLSLAAQANDVSGHLTLQALRCAAEVVSLSAPAQQAGVLRGEACVTALQVGLYTVLNTRFEMTDAATDVLVYMSLMDLCRAVVCHPASAYVSGTLLIEALTACVRSSLDASHARGVRQAAVTSLLHCASAVTRAAVVQRGAGAQAALLHLLHMLCDLLGVDDDDATTAPGLGDTHPRAQLVPHAFLLPLTAPVPVTEDLTPHVAHGTGPEGSGAAVSVNWKQHLSSRGANMSSSAASSVDVATVDGDMAGTPTLSPPSALPRRSLSDGSFSHSGNPSGVDSNNRGAPSAGSMRLQRVSDGAALLCLRVARAVLDALAEADADGSLAACEEVFQQRLVLVIQRRLFIALLWCSDGCGSDALQRAAVPLDSSGGGSGLLAALFGGSSSSSQFSAAAAAAINRSAASISMKLPQLPLMQQALHVFLALTRIRSFRSALSVPVEHFLLRTIVRALSAPARLLAACAVYLGLPVLRVIVPYLVSAQRERDAAMPAVRSAGSAAAQHTTPLASSADHVVAASYAIAQPSISSLVRTMTAALAAASVSSDFSLAVDSDTLRTLCAMFAPRSPLILVCTAALDALTAMLAVNPCCAPQLFLQFDAVECRSDVLRALLQSCSALALGQAHVHTLHGTLHAPESGGASANTPLSLPLPQVVRTRALSCLTTMLQSCAVPNESRTAPPADVLARIRSNMRNKRLLQTCARAFNAKPKRGVEALRATALLGGGAGTPQHGAVAAAHPGSPASAQAAPSSPPSASGSSAAAAGTHTAIAYLLHTYASSAGFDPVAVGEYLGGGDSADDDAKRRAHVSICVEEFAGQSLVSALRLYLRSFRLPGEAQQIDRILQAFAGVAHTSCKEGSLLASIDATYLLAFSIIMLNTDLHNANIRADRKMTVEAFVRNNTDYGKDICHGRRIPEETLRAIYEEIKWHPIAPPPSSYSLLPLLAPAQDGGLAVEGNAAATASFAGAGDVVTQGDWLRALRSGASQVAAPVTDNIHVGRILALPEAWHACVRVSLCLFADCFKHSALRAAFSGAAGHAASAHAGSPAQHEDAHSRAVAAVKAAAQVHLRTLTVCASAAAAAGLHSGVDIIIAALCRTAAHSLKSVGSAAAGAQGGTGVHSTGTMSEGPSTPNSGVSSGSGTLFGHSRVPSSFALAPLHSPSGSPGHAKDVGGPRIHPAGVAADFGRDLRAQLALSTALSLACPPARTAVAVSTHGWRWICECMVRMARVGILRLPVARILELQSGPTGDGGDKSGDSSDSAAALEGWQPGGEHSDSLLHAYAVASAAHRHMQRAHRAAIARRMVEEVLDASAALSGRSGESGGDGAAAASSGIVTLANAASPGQPKPHVQETATSEAPAGEHAGNGGIGSVLFGWLFGATEVEPDAATDSGAAASSTSAGGTAASGTGLGMRTLSNATGVVNNIEVDLSTSPEWAELVAEEDEADLAGSSSGTAAEARGASGALVAVATAIPGSHLDAVCNDALAVLSRAHQLPPAAFARFAAALLYTAAALSVPLSFADFTEGAAASQGAAADAEETVAAAHDDGSAFISGMETARYKCALLPPPGDVPASSFHARLALQAYAVAVTEGINQMRSIAAIRRMLPPVMSLALSVVMEASVPSRRVRAASGAALHIVALCVQQMADLAREQPSEYVDDVIDSVLHFMRELVCSPAPTAGCMRLLVSATLAGACAANEHVTRLLWRVSSSMGSNLMVRILYACLKPGWEDEDGDADVEPPSAAADGGAAAATNEDGAADAGTPLFPLSDAEDDDVHVLELTLAATCRMCCHVLSSLLAYAGDPAADDAVLRAAVLMLHPRYTTTTITLDDVSMAALQLLSKLLLPASGEPGNNSPATALVDLFTAPLAADATLSSAQTAFLHIAEAAVDARLPVRLAALELLPAILAPACAEKSASAAACLRHVCVPLAVASLANGVDPAADARTALQEDAGTAPFLLRVRSALLTQASRILHAADELAASNSAAQTAPSVQLAEGATGAGAVPAESAATAEAPPATAQVAQPSPSPSLPLLPPAVLCERSVLMSVSLLTRLYLHALPVLQATGDTEALWKCVQQVLDTACDVASKCDPKAPALYEALCECARNAVMVTRAECSADGVPAAWLQIPRELQHC